MLSLREFEEILNRITPPHLRPEINRFANELVASINAQRDQEEITIPSEPNSAAMLLFSLLAGREIETDNTVLSFGKGSQIGDVTVRDVAKNITHVTFNYFGHNQITKKEGEEKARDDAITSITAEQTSRIGVFEPPVLNKLVQLPAPAFGIKENRPHRKIKEVTTSRLYELLSSGKFQEADRETLNVLLIALDQQGFGWLREKDIAEIPCTILHQIDELWSTHSQKKYGLTAQLEIWKEISADQSLFDAQSFQTFGEVVGWVENGEWIRSLTGFNFFGQAPKGHLPSLRFSTLEKELHWWDAWKNTVKSFLLQTYNCL